MGLLSNTGLLASVPQKSTEASRSQQQSTVELRCEVTPAPFMLRPYAGLYNPFSHGCSVLCNHPADTEAKEFVRRAKDSWLLEGKTHCFGEDLSKIQDLNGPDKDKIRTPHDIVTEDMFRRYTETDSRPLTPAPTLASGKSRGSRRCLTPDQPHPRTTIVLDLRRSHSQETLYYHGYTTSDMTPGHTTSATNDRSLPSLNLSEGTHARLIKGQCEQLPPLASPLVLSKRAPTVKETMTSRSDKKGTHARLIKGQCEQLPPLASPLVLSKRAPTVKETMTSRSDKKVSDCLRQSVDAIYDCVRYLALEGTHARLIKGQCEQLPPLASPLVLSKRAPTVKETMTSRSDKKVSHSLTQSVDAIHDCVRYLALEGTHARLIKGQCEQLPPLASPLVLSKRAPTVKETMTSRSDKKNQLKALKLGKAIKNSNKNKSDAPAPASQRSKSEKDNDGSETVRVSLDGAGDGGEMRRRGKKHRKGRPTGSDRLTSAGLAAQTQQDPETQIAGIGTDSQNPSSRGSIAPVDDDVIALPVIRPIPTARKTDSFLDDDILKYLHREVDEEAIETEFDTKRRYVLEEALRTRPERPHGVEMQALLRDLKVPAVSLGDWLHIPRVFTRQSAVFSLPIDSAALETLTPMQYAARFVTLKKSKQLLYLTVLRKFRPEGYRMPIQDIGEGLMLMMGGILTPTQVDRFRGVMEWEGYEEEENIPDEIKLTLLDTGYRKRERRGSKDSEESDANTLKYRTWCGLCAICERMYGRFPPREKDPPDGIELSDFTMIETKLAMLKVHPGLIEVLNTIRVR